MSRITAIRKQIATLEAEAERITAAEKSSAVARIVALMTDAGVTLEDLQAATHGKRPRTAKAPKSNRAKRVGAGKPKYADPKTGKTWSGFGRIPGWIASAKNRDVFLVDRQAQVTKPRQVKASAAATKRAKAQAASKAPSHKKTFKVAAKGAVAKGPSRKAAPRKNAPASRKRATLVAETPKATGANDAAVSQE